VGHFKEATERHPIVPYCREGRLCKEETAALNKTMKVHLDPDGKNLGWIAEDKWVQQLEDT
jgi:hypothetical protein